MSMCLPTLMSIQIKLTCAFRKNSTSNITQTIIYTLCLENFELIILPEILRTSTITVRTTAAA